MSRNPFKRISRILSVTGTVLGTILVLAWITLMIWVAVARYSWHILWQAPAVFLALILVFVVLYGISYSIKVGWNKLADRWDRKHGIR